ncbi:MAG: peptide chain release factor 2, partial [Candidatus Gracilibacteria bacterium]
MHEVKTQLDELQTQITTALKAIDLDTRRHRIIELEILMQESDFWNDQKKAQDISREASHTRTFVERWEKLQQDLKELQELFPTIDPETDPTTAQEYKAMVAKLAQDWRALEIQTFLNGKYDTNNVILSLHAGTGGKDAQDFAEMLMRMYLRWAEKHEFKATILDQSQGEEVGLKSADILIEGEFAYGYLKSENGVHRLVRQSPFNAKASRETSFVLIEVLPEISDAAQIDIKKDDLRVDTYRSSAPGGQNVQKTDSAIRITHLPTNIVVSCQTERSQLQNKETAMKILAAKLADMMERAHAKTLSDLKGGKIEMSWGNQIRSYVLHPYKMVKDHRTDYEERNVEPILDGDIDGFIEA